eukprot:365632-Chlamydomonas_euryale.AAC.34
MPYGHACCCTAAVMAPYDAPKLWHCIAICLEGCGLACMELAGECADPNLTSLCRPLLGFRKAKRSAETVADVDNARHGRHAAVAGVVPHVPGVPCSTCRAPQRAIRSPKPHYPPLPNSRTPQISSICIYDTPGHDSLPSSAQLHAEARQQRNREPGHVYSR